MTTQSEGISRRGLLGGALAVGAVAASSGLLAACSNGGNTPIASPSGAAGPARAGGRLVVGMPIPATDSLDPQNFVAAGDKVRAFNITERLAMVNADGTIKLHLAESTEPMKADATVWRIKLREGITHSNGKTLDGEDVLASWGRLATDSPFASTLDPFVDLRNSKVATDGTIEIHCKTPIGDFNRFMAQEPLGIMPAGSTSFGDPKDLIGTGPFTLAEWNPGKRALMVKNPNYWENGKPYLDEFEIVSLNQDSDQPGALLSGQVDGTSGLSSAQIKQLENNPAVTLMETPSINSPAWYMRLDSDAFGDVRVRQAFKMAIDREQCVDIVLGGRGDPGNDLQGSLFPSFNRDLPQREYDPDAARSLLREAGHEGIEVELVTANFVDGATAYAQQAKEAGINIKVKRVPPEDIYNTDLYYLKVPFGETLWTGSFEDAAPQGYTSTATYNETGWMRPEWDQKFFQGFGTVDEDARYSIYRELQEELWNDGGHIVWAYGSSVTAQQPYVQGVVPWGTVSWWNGLRFEDVWRSE